MKVLRISCSIMKGMKISRGVWCWKYCMMHLEYLVHSRLSRVTSETTAMRVGLFRLFLRRYRSSKSTGLSQNHRKGWPVRPTDVLLISGISLETTLFFLRDQVSAYWKPHPNYCPKGIFFNSLLRLVSRNSLVISKHDPYAVLHPSVLYKDFLCFWQKVPEISLFSQE